MRRDLETAHYQKSASRVRTSSTWVVRYARPWLPLLAMFISSCSSVDAQQSVAAPDPAQVRPAATATAASTVAALGTPQIFHAAIQPPPMQAGLPPSPDTPAREALVAAHDGKGSSQWPNLLQAAAAQADSDPLGMYAKYWLLRYRLAYPQPGSDAFGQARRFIQAYPDTYLANRMRADLILDADARGDFQAVMSLGEPVNPSMAVACARLDAQHMTGQRATAAQALAIFRPVHSCWQLYDQLVADRVLGWDQIMPQVREAIEDNRIPEARRLAGYLLEPQDVKTLDVLLKDPMKWLAHRSKSVVGRNEKALVSIALVRIGRQNLDTADAYFRSQWQPYMAKNEVAWVRSQYALMAAYAQDDRADRWYRELGNAPLTETGRAWRVRSALRAAKIDWKWVVDCIDQMPPGQRAQPSWEYWRARGLTALGQVEAARQGYASIAGRFGFYGQLAAEALGRAIALPPEAAPVTADEMAQARRNPGLIRAVQLFRLGWRAEAVPEWNYALRDMDDRQLLAAAELARSEGIYDRVVNTSDLTQSQFDFTQRYIAPFDGKVAAKALAISLDPAWVYGLIRQESRFVTDAHSHVGAAGLMQIMPATARWVAKKIGMTGFDPSSVHDFEVNTELGTQYLNMVLQKLDGSELLASAGYNAGPGRPRNWRAALTHPVEGAIFAETIPFNETRDYVQRVMANTTYYALLFTGRPQSLKARLGRIDPAQVLATSNTQ
ncbi:MAG TPA: transglycosylase SLT domain-containing protein [Bordetella sp.]|uniref:lytic transglycosylase domain-containing protein n=1 Tax=Bordetella sp. TaxID=28081 RepID=UPI002ECFE83A